MFLEPLKTIADRCEGLCGAALVGRDGLPIDSYVATDEHDLEMISAELVALARSAQDNHAEFGAGFLKAVAVETPDHILLLGEAAEDVYLLMMLTRKELSPTALAKARFEVRRAPLLLRPALFGEG